MKEMSLPRLIAIVLCSVALGGMLMELKWISRQEFAKKAEGLDDALVLEESDPAVESLMEEFTQANLKAVNHYGIALYGSLSPEFDPCDDTTFFIYTEDDWVLKDDVAPYLKLKIGGRIYRMYLSEEIHYEKADSKP